MGVDAVVRIEVGGGGGRANRPIYHADELGALEDWAQLKKEKKRRKEEEKKRKSALPRSLPLPQQTHTARDRLPSTLAEIAHGLDRSVCCPRAPHRENSRQRTWGQPPHLPPRLDRASRGSSHPAGRITDRGVGKTVGAAFESLSFLTLQRRPARRH